MRRLNNDLLRAHVDACRQGLCMEGPTYPKQLCFSLRSLSDLVDFLIVHRGKMQPAQQIPPLVHVVPNHLCYPHQQKCGLGL